MAEVIELEKVRWKLVSIWFGGSAILFMILVLQSLRNLFGDQLDKAWAWIIPNIAPTLSLMISVLATHALVPQAEVDKLVARRSFYTLSCWLSLFYLFNILIVVCSAPFAVSEHGIGTHPVDVLHISNFWLGPLQGLTVASIGARSEREKEGDVSHTSEKQRHPRRPSASVPGSSSRQAAIGDDRQGDARTR